MIDLNCYLGHYAFRQLRYNTADALLKWMDEKGIDRAVVSSAAAITFRNVQPANEELAKETAPHLDRLIPFAVLNPAYAGWTDDLTACRESLGMKGVRLHPGWHGYKASDACCDELVHAAAERGMPISLPIRVEDNRQRHWLVDVPDEPLGEIVKLVQGRPDARFVLCAGGGFTGSELGRKESGLGENYLIGICRMTALLHDEMGTLIANLGPQRLAFESGMPFHYPDPAILKVRVQDVSEEAKERILTKNAEEFLAAP